LVLHLHLSLAALCRHWGGAPGVMRSRPARPVAHKHFRSVKSQDGDALRSLEKAADATDQALGRSICMRTWATHGPRFVRMWPLLSQFPSMEWAKSSVLPLWSIGSPDDPPRETLHRRLLSQLPLPDPTPSARHRDLHPGNLDWISSRPIARF
jgi:hypothetical protein